MIVNSLARTIVAINDPDDGPDVFTINGKYATSADLLQLRLAGYPIVIFVLASAEEPQYDFSLN